MSEIHYSVVGIGNAIVDVIGHCEENFLLRHNAVKGHMRIVDASTVSNLYSEMGPAIEISGGSAANTMVGISSFGGRAAFIGKIADDEFGRIFKHDIISAGVTFKSRPTLGEIPTSRSLILVTPDGERTMNTFLGISTQLDNGDIDRDLIQASEVLYLEGYLFDQPEAKKAFFEALKLANKASTKVALTLSDSFCVDRHREEFLKLIRSGVDILFANESEITALYETEDFEVAAQKAASNIPLAVLTRSAKGSVILCKDRSYRINVEPVSKVIDTTGAGDLYAAGFLYGLTSGRDLETSGRLGSLAAAEIISHIGARPQKDYNELAFKKRIIT